MKLSFLIISSMMMLTAYSCSTDQSVSDDKYQSVLPEQVEVLNQSENSVTFGLFTSCGSACWGEFQQIVSNDENTYEIKTLAEVTAELCTQQCVPYNWEYAIEIPEPGDYTFQFTHRDSVYHVLNISFP
jgi:hypothetical protein